LASGKQRSATPSSLRARQQQAKAVRVKTSCKHLSRSFPPQHSQSVTYREVRGLCVSATCSTAPSRKPACSPGLGAGELSASTSPQQQTSPYTVHAPITRRLILHPAPLARTSSTPTMAELRRKLVIVGDGACGKTCLLM
jgi:hypothetical protein